MTIEEYNNYLVENKEINKLISNIKLSDIDNCCIHHSMLKNMMYLT